MKSKLQKNSIKMLQINTKFVTTNCIFEKIKPKKVQKKVLKIYCHDLILVVYFYSQVTITSELGYLAYKHFNLIKNYVEICQITHFPKPQIDICGLHNTQTPMFGENPTQPHTHTHSPASWRDHFPPI